jgi:hypothetical protein
MSKEPVIQKSRVARPTRKSVGARDRLQIINRDPNKEYRLVSTEDSRIYQMRGLGYEVVNIADHLPTGLRLDNSTATDNCIPVGGGQKQVLMAIDKDLYLEGIKEKEEENRKREAGLHPNLSDGQYGKITLSTKAED